MSKTMPEIVEELKVFMEQEDMSCSMDFGCMTPLYLYRMWGGTVAVEEIANARLDDKCKKMGLSQIFFGIKRMQKV